MTVGAISITEEEYRKLNASRHAVKVPLNLRGGYMALPEFVHQIHCVVRTLKDRQFCRKVPKFRAQKMLWEQTYPEYYTEAHDWSLNYPKQFHEHIGMAPLQVIDTHSNAPFLTKINT